MADRRVTVTISAQDSFSQVMNKYNAAMNQATKSTQDFSAAGTKSSKGVNDLSNAVGEMVKGFVLYKALDITTEMVNQGRAANAIEATFKKLAGTVGDYHVVLQQMRDATGGVVNDMQLMQAGSQLFQMGLAKNGEEMAKLTELAVKLGGAMGHDTKESIESFSLMLANSSIPRLDLFGISAGKVRERIKELQDEMGVSRQEAFKMAVLEQGQQALDRLGDSAMTNVNSLSKFEAQWDNTMMHLKQGVADVVIAAATSLDQLGQIVSMTMSQVQTGNPNSAGNTLGQAVVAKMKADAAAAMHQQFLSEFAQRNQLEFNMGGTTSRYDPMFQAKMFNAQMGQSVTGNTPMFGDMTAGMDFSNQQSAAQQQLAQFTSQMGAGVGNFMRPEDADRIKASFEALQALADKGLIDDKDLVAAKEFADQAEKASDAFDKMSKTDVFGQTNGGLMGQVSDDLIQQMKDRGASPESIAATQRQLDLASGRETGSSLAYQDKVVPMLDQIQQTFGDAAVAKAIENLTAFMQQAKVMNLTDAQIAGGLASATGFSAGGPGQQFQVLPGQGIGQVASQYGLTNQQVMGAAGNGQYIFPGMYSTGQGVGKDNVAGFDPIAYANSLAAGGGDFGSGAMNAGGENPLDQMALASEKLKDNMDASKENIDAATGAAAELKDALDIAATPRDVVFVAKLDDRTNGALSFLLGTQNLLNVNLSSTGVGGTRDRGGNQTNAGVDARNNRKGQGGGGKR